MNKDKIRIGELEGKAKARKVLVITLSLVSIFLFLGCTYASYSNDKQRAENIELLKENNWMKKMLVEQGVVWSVKTRCINEIVIGVEMETVSIANFTNHTFYKEFMIHYKNKLPSNCEIIEEDL